MSVPEAELLKQGILGIVAVVEWGVIVLLFREYRKAQQARIQDAQATQQALLEVTEKLVEAINRLHEVAERLAPRR